MIFNAFLPDEQDCYGPVNQHTYNTDYNAFKPGKLITTSIKMTIGAQRMLSTVQIPDSYGIKNPSCQCSNSMKGNNKSLIPGIQYNTYGIYDPIKRP